MTTHCKNGHPYSDKIHSKCPACERGDAPVFGTALHKLHRKDAPDTSVAAAGKVDTGKDEELVYRHICRSGENGLTNKELEPLMGKAMSSFSGRVSALIGKELVKDSGKRRDGCRVIVGVSA